MWRKVCAQNGDDFSTRRNGSTRGKAALLSSEHPITGSIKPKLNVGEDGESILAMDQRLNQSSISQVQESYIKYNQTKFMLNIYGVYLKLI